MEVVGEDATPRLPVLGVQVAAVACLQLLDGFDLQQGCGGVHHSSVTLATRGWISTGSGAVLRTMGGCLPRDYGCAAVTHVRQNRIRATRLRR